ncbi:PAS domain-containing sensor histidine kinase [Ramlibacter henchirensis]|uniref:histidine kinase n=1 Tax=Ramlibacter henchirensis TaxID=204072 RepID=A0A4Z0C5F6_9BURK|nr:PAS domain-containing sensor histidine kinase [Ramlibacter henchirensis]TFZ06194.1 PAS domain-containing sensor histidine kinase [Ramlibacter henchirensis]
MTADMQHPPSPTRGPVEAKVDARKLLASEARFQRLLDSNIMGVGVTHSNGQVLQANDEYLRILGHTREELQAGRVWWARLTPPEFLPVDEMAIAEANRKGSCVPYEKEYERHSDGVRVPVQIAFTTLLDQPEQFVVYVIDVTSRKTIEEELRRANRRKDEFLATLSHELRNPLAPMATAIHVLRKVCPAQDDELARSSLSIIERQVRHMTRLVDDLLDMARITSGKVLLRREEVELLPIVKSALEATRSLMERRRHQVHLDLGEEPIRLHADGVRVEQMLTNLLSNAAKYTYEGGRISVRIERGEGEVVIRVQDNGIGIAGDMLPLVFEPFAQAETARGYADGGLGIGLALVRRFAQMHGGSISVHSEGLGAGSEFTLALPALPRAEP